LQNILKSANFDLYDFIMKDLVFQNCTLSEVSEIARKILDEYQDERVFAFYGDLGAGKTTLIKALCNVLGVTEEVTSPSFAIINEYESGGVDLIYHFDFYRIKKLEEVLDIGYEEYLYSGYYCFLEWAEKIEELLPGRFVSITITKNENDKGRVISTSFIS
jgi:tRNA threonylcarbamoyladenosine biosynthesis protein TsaE